MPSMTWSTIWAALAPWTPPSRTFSTDDFYRPSRCSSRYSVIRSHHHQIPTPSQRCRMKRSPAWSSSSIVLSKGNCYFRVANGTCGQQQGSNSCRGTPAPILAPPLKLTIVSPFCTISTYSATVHWKQIYDSWSKVIRGWPNQSICFKCAIGD